jgi:hypothetical protein
MPRRQEVSEEKGNEKPKEEATDPKDQAGGGAPKMFRRKSGSA